MKNNTVAAYNGVEIYTHDFLRLLDEYKTDLVHEDDIYNSDTFTGLIKYINLNIHFDKDIYENIDILNNIWDMYTGIVYRYKFKPTIEEFALLTGISRDTFYAWANGEYRSTDMCEKLGTSRPDTVKKWIDECKLGRYKGAAAGNVGYIFLCKAVDGYVERSETVIVKPEQHRTAEQIAADYGPQTALPGDVQPDF